MPNRMLPAACPTSPLKDPSWPMMIGAPWLVQAAPADPVPPVAPAPDAEDVPPLVPGVPVPAAVLAEALPEVTAAPPVVSCGAVWPAGPEPSGLVPASLLPPVDEPETIPLFTAAVPCAAAAICASDCRVPQAAVSVSIGRAARTSNLLWRERIMLITIGSFSWTGCRAFEQRASAAES